MSFPTDFLWGAASAAYQIEGAASEDGRGPSVWDTFSHTPEKTFDGHTGDIACDSYHRFEEDLEALKLLGVKHYRFGISWTRIFPDGKTFNERGFAYYDKVVDLLLQNGITPWVTLFHWDTPQALEDEGGWQNRETARLLAQFAGVVRSLPASSPSISTGASITISRSTNRSASSVSVTRPAGMHRGKR